MEARLLLMVKQATGIVQRRVVLVLVTWVKIMFFLIILAILTHSLFIWSLIKPEMPVLPEISIGAKWNMVLQKISVPQGSLLRVILAWIHRALWVSASVVPEATVLL